VTRALAILSLAVVAGCGRPAAAQTRAQDDADVALLWSARPPSDSGGLTVVAIEVIPWSRVPRRGLDEADQAAPVLPVLDGAAQLQVQEGLAGDDLVIVGPPSSFVAATAGANDLRDLGAGERDVAIRLPVERGSSAAAVLEVANAALAGRMRSPRARGGAFLGPGASSVISIDVLWPTGADEPTLTVALSRSGVAERTTGSSARFDRSID